MCTVVLGLTWVWGGGQVETGRFPGAYHEADATRLVEIATSLLQEAKKEGEPETLDEAAQKVLKTLAYVSGSELNPMAAFLGGVVGQEVVKAVSGKFSPLNQWFYFDSIESLPDEAPTAEDLAPLVPPLPSCQKPSLLIANSGSGNVMVPGHCSMGREGIVFDHGVSIRAALARRRGREITYRSKDPVLELAAFLRGLAV